jgi:hypothetical protein
MFENNKSFKFPATSQNFNITGFKIIFMYKYNQNIIHSICKKRDNKPLKFYCIFINHLQYKPVKTRGKFCRGLTMFNRVKLNRCPRWTKF